jgi:hypothetical protein
MLRVEKLVCENPKFHKHCVWVKTSLTYPDYNFLTLRQRLIREVKKTNTAYRIVHHRYEILTTIKLGHDRIIYISDNEDAQRHFALAPADIATWLK